MIKYYLMGALVIFLLLVLGCRIGISYMTRRAADGVCIRADDGEVYLRLSELGQAKLADPETKLLYLMVMDVSTRNKQSL